MTAEEEEDRTETAPRIFIHNIRGLKVRRHVSPSRSSPRELYRIERSVRRGIRGLRVSFTLFQQNHALYSTKLKGRRSSIPVPIARGGEMHYRDPEFAAYLLSGNKHTQFSLRAITTFGSELLTVKFSIQNGDRPLPRNVELNFFLKDSLVPQKLKSKTPKLNPDGHWGLDFGERPLVPSVRNHIFVQEETDLEFMTVRKVAKHTIEVDAVTLLSSLAVFGIVLSLFEC
jgi:hypothetical protein